METAFASLAISIASAEYEIATLRRTCEDSQRALIALKEDRSRADIETNARSSRDDDVRDLSRKATKKENVPNSRTKNDVATVSGTSEDIDPQVDPLDRYLERSKRIRERRNKKKTRERSTSTQSSSVSRCVSSSNRRDKKETARCVTRDASATSSSRRSRQPHHIHRRRKHEGGAKGRSAGAPVRASTAKLLETSVRTSTSKRSEAPVRTSTSKRSDVSKVRDSTPSSLTSTRSFESGTPLRPSSRKLQMPETFEMLRNTWCKILHKERRRRKTCDEARREPRQHDVSDAKRRFLCRFASDGTQEEHESRVAANDKAVLRGRFEQYLRAIRLDDTTNGFGGGSESKARARRDEIDDDISASLRRAAAYERALLACLSDEAVVRGEIEKKTKPTDTSRERPLCRRRRNERVSTQEAIRQHVSLRDRRLATRLEDPNDALAQSLDEALFAIPRSSEHDVTNDRNRLSHAQYLLERDVLGPSLLEELRLMVAADTGERGPVETLRVARAAHAVLACKNRAGLASRCVFLPDSKFLRELSEDARRAQLQRRRAVGDRGTSG